MLSDFTHMLEAEKYNAPQKGLFCSFATGLFCSRSSRSIQIRSKKISCCERQKTTTSTAMSKPLPRTAVETGG